MVMTARVPAASATITGRAVRSALTQPKSIEGPENSGKSLAPLPIWRLRKVKAHIESEIAAPLRLKDLATVAGLSCMHFAAQFRVATGFRPHEYVLIRRIERAKALIEGNDMSFVEVALDVGFQSQAHFCTIFKRMTGMTPSCWRQQWCGLYPARDYPAQPMAGGVGLPGT